MASRLVLPSALRLARNACAVGSLRAWVSAITWIAWLSRRLLPRFSRYFVERPLLAGIGAVPLCLAKRLEVAKRSTLRTSPMISAATITPTPWISVSVVPVAGHQRTQALLEHPQLTVDAPQIGKP